MKILNFTSPQGQKISVNSPDGSVPSEQELDQMFAQASKTPKQEAMASNEKNPAMQGGAKSPANIQAQKNVQDLSKQNQNLDTQVAPIKAAYNMTWPLSAAMNKGGEVPEPTSSGGRLLSDAGAFANPLTQEAIGLAGKYVAKPLGQLAGKIPVGGGNNLGDVALKASGKFEKAINDRILNLYKYAIGGKIKNISKLGTSDANRLTSVKAVSENAPNLKLQSPETGMIESRTPQNRLENFDALRQTKQAIWAKVNALSKGATDLGAMVNLDDVADQALKTVKGEVGEPLSTFKPETMQKIQQLVDSAKLKGKISPTQAQQYLKFLNSQLQSERGQVNDWAVTDFYKAMRSKLVDSTDKSIMDSLNKTGYAELRKQYGALLDTEKEQLAAANKFIAQESGKGYGITHPLLDLWSMEDVFEGIARGEPSKFVTAAGKQLVKKTLDFMKSPDRRIIDMYKTAARLPKTPEIMPKPRLNIGYSPENVPNYLKDRENIPPIPKATGEAKIIPPKKIELEKTPRKESARYNKGTVIDLRKGDPGKGVGFLKKQKIKELKRDINPSLKGKSLAALGTAGLGSSMVNKKADAEEETLGQKDNNPGNLKSTEKWNGMTGKDKQGHAIFKTRELGERALIKDLQTHKRKNMNQSLEDFMNHYAEKNGTSEAKFIASHLKINPKTKLKDVDIYKMAKYLSKIESKTDISDNEISKVRKDYNL